MTSKNENKISRRQLLRMSVSIWSAVLALPFLYGLIKFFNPVKNYHTFRIRINPALIRKEILINDIPENSARNFIIDDNNYLVIRKTGEDVKVLDGICTHMDCILSYRKDSNEIYCNCHGGKFDINGNVLEGPPKINLKKYNFHISDNRIIID